MRNNARISCIFDKVCRDWHWGKNRYLFEDALVKHMPRLAMERVEGEFEVQRRGLDMYLRAGIAIMIMMRQ